MAINRTSFFLSLGTVALTMGVGFGGGVWLTDAFMAKDAARPPTRLEQRAIDKKVSPVVAAIAPAAQAAPTDVAAQAAEPQPVRQPVPSVAPAPGDAYARAHDDDLQREARRQEHVKRSEMRRSAERKQRKPRAIAARSRPDDAGRQGSAPRELVAETPRFEFYSSSN